MGTADDLVMQTGNRLLYHLIWQPCIMTNFFLFGNKFFSIFQIFSDCSKVKKSYLSATSAIVDCSCG
jgi:hypothetical protein